MLDLIGIPYKRHGRDKDGLDCYGACIEVSKRNGTPLNDIKSYNFDLDMLQKNLPSLNLEPAEKIEKGVLLEMNALGRLHIGVCLDTKTFIHATINQGVRISEIGMYDIVNIWKIV